jgi:hypothetical protein
MVFVMGDYFAGMMVGVVTAVAVRMVVWPGMDMVIAMMPGMALGTILHLVLGVIFAPPIGMFEAMIPGSLIGMYGGMFFGMRDSMAAGSRTYHAAIMVGALFGAVVVAVVHYYDRALRGTIVDSSE